MINFGRRNIFARQRDCEPLPSVKVSDTRSGVAPGWRMRRPLPADGPAVTELIAACPPLDTNSRYSTLIQCSHFAEHCIVAEQDGAMMGWISGHRLPSDPATFFIWQVAVAPQARGLGLASRMIDELLARPAQAGVTHLITTVTEDNAASWALFNGLARQRGVTLVRKLLFDRETHFAGHHASEYEARIGPLTDEKFQTAQG